MGRRNRERIERIRAGIEMPISLMVKTSQPTLKLTTKPALLHCMMCNNTVLSTEVRQHIKDCWGVELAANEPVPFFNRGEKAKLMAWIAKRHLSG